MDIAPKDLNIPLKKRRYFDAWFFLTCVALSAYKVKPNSLASWIVIVGLVAPTFWFTFSGPAFLSNWILNHRYPYVGWLVFTIKCALFYFVIYIFSPVAISFVSGWVHV